MIFMEKTYMLAKSEFLLFVYKIFQIRLCIAISLLVGHAEKK